MFGLKGTELLLILVVLLLLFGSTRLPQLGSSLGSAIRNFKKGFSGDESADEKPANANLTATSSTPTRDEPSKVSAPRNG